MRVAGQDSREENGDTGGKGVLKRSLLVAALVGMVGKPAKSFAMFLAHQGFNNDAMRVQKAKGIEEWK